MECRILRNTDPQALVSAVRNCRFEYTARNRKIFSRGVPAAPGWLCISAWIVLWNACPGPRASLVYPDGGAFAGSSLAYVTSRMLGVIRFIESPEKFIQDAGLGSYALDFGLDYNFLQGRYNEKKIGSEAGPDEPVNDSWNRECLCR